ncbi:anti-sigma factor [Nocardioides sediminis]|uniref:anti-sigma factor n=1 Tax=Nocardioides sediminis TaxID=433648 RepID=UPI000D2FE8E7|nr:anti-sigma factor [Nocardioides sediminis]
MNDIHHLTGAYALDAVDDLERARFEQHLAECEDCRAEVASLREAAVLLAETSAVAPPPSLRDSVLSGISQVRPLPPVVERTRVVHRRWFPLLVAAAVVAILGVGAAIWQPWSPSEDSSLTAAERVLTAPDAQSVAIDLGEAGRATVTRSESVGKAVITTEDMAPAPTGKVFELWLQDDQGAMIPAGLMPPGEDNQVVLKGDAAAATAVGITVEPEGGSSEPTSDPIALFDFSQAA